MNREETKKRLLKMKLPDGVALTWRPQQPTDGAVKIWAWFWKDVHHDEPLPDNGPFVLQAIDFTKRKLDDFCFDEARLDHARLCGVRARRASFCHATLKGAKFCGARLDLSFFTRADMESANMSHSSLRRAVFRGANLKNARLDGANLDNADVGGANFSEIGFVTPGQMARTTHLEHAFLRPGMFADAVIAGYKLRQCDFPASILAEIARQTDLPRDLYGDVSGLDLSVYRVVTVSQLAFLSGLEKANIPSGWLADVRAYRSLL